MNRRELLRGLALGGAVIAGELWIPGKKLISIPKPLWLSSDEKWWFAQDVARDPARFVWQKVWWDAHDGKFHAELITDQQIYEAGVYGIGPVPA